MPKQLLALICFCLAGLTLGCNAEPELSQQGEPRQVPVDLPSVGDNRLPQREWKERDFDIIRFVLSQADDLQVNDPAAARSQENRLWFLTTTPSRHWGPRGDWDSLPASFHETLNSSYPNVRPANDAYLKSGYVYGNGTHEPASMIWITVKKWNSPTEVEVETGTWSGPLDGAGSTKIYEQRDGRWQIKRVVGSWQS